jgi:hypothetical protein
MASRDFLKHVVSTTEPTGSTLGDEWYNPSTNILSKRLVVNGTTVRFVQLGGGLTVQQSGTTIVSNTSALNFPGASVAHNTITGVTDILASGTPGGSNTQVQFNNAGAFGGSSNLVWNNGSQTLTVTGFFAANQVRATGGLNASAWTTTGPIFNTSGSLTDVSGSGGTVALRTSTSFNTNTWSASVATTVTDAATLYVESPTAGSNISITNPYSIYASGLVRASGFVAGSSRVVDWKNTTAQWTLSGGGLITWNGSSVLWGTRVIAIPVENTEMGSAGYFDINCPTSGTVVYYNSAGVTTTLTATGSGIPIAAWEALYYEVTEGQGSASDQTKFRVVNYQNPNWRPGPGWILICAVNGDGTNVGHLKWLPGQVNLPTTGATVTYNTGTGVSSWLPAGTGTVTSVSVVSANGFAGSVATASSTPAITLSTSVTGILYGNGTSVAAAVAGNFPTLNQATTASAAVLRQVDGTNFMGPTDPRGASGARGTDLNPNAYAYGLFSEFKNSSLYTGVAGNYSGLLTYANYNGTVSSTGDPSYSLLFSPQGVNATTPPRLQIRAGIDTTWGKFSDILHSGNHLSATSSWTPNYTGGVRGYANGSFRKDSGNNNTWDGQVYSSETYSTRVFCGARPGETNTNVMWGLNSDPTTDSSYTSIDYAWYFDNGTYRIYENSANPYSGTTYSVNDYFAITYDGSYVRYWVNDTMVRSVARAVSGTLAFDSSFYQAGATGASLQAVAFGSLTHSPYNTLANFRHNSLTLGGAAVDPVANAGQLTLNNGALGTTLNTVSNPFVSIRGTQSNASFLDFNFVRDAAGSDWTTAGTRIQQKIDSTWMAYMQFNGASVNGGIEWGSGTTTTSATSISARMRLDSSGILRLLTNASSSSTTTGTLVVTGGTGISENLYVGGYSQHAGGLVRANSRFTSSERYPVGHYTDGETVFSIDPTMTQTELQAFFNTSSVSWNNDTTAPGYCIQIDGNPSFAAVAYGSGFPLIPVETDDIFYMEVWLRNDPTYTGAGHYMGSVDISASGASLGGNPGSFGYWVMSNTPGSTTWTRYSGYITGFGTATGQFVANTKYWTPQMLANYSYSGGTRRSFISGWKVIKVNQRANRKFAGHVAFSVNSAVSAAGSTQGTATAITTDVVNVTGGSGGVILPYWQPGHRIVVRNALGSAINVYPNSGAQINTAGTNVAVSVLAGSTIEFINISSTQWAIVNAVYA